MNAEPAIKTVAKQLGHTPTALEYHTHKPTDAPTAEHLFTTHDGWRTVLHNAGLAQDAPYHPDKPTRQDCLNALEHFYNTHGYSPTTTEYRSETPDTAPTPTDITTHVHSWNNAKDILDIPPRTGKPASAAKELAQNLGHIPTKTEFDQYDNTTFTAQDIRNRFGSWNNFRTLELTKLEQKFAINALHDVKNAIGKSPTKHEYTTHRTPDHPSATTIKRRFGSWNNAKETAGLTQYHTGDHITYYGPDWNDTAEQIRNRDGHCQRCETSRLAHINQTDRDLDVHHLHKLRTFFADLTDHEQHFLNNNDTDEPIPDALREKIDARIERANHPSNLVSVCRDCHQHLENLTLETQLDELNTTEPTVSP